MAASSSIDYVPRVPHFSSHRYELEIQGFKAQLAAAVAAAAESKLRYGA